MQDARCGCAYLKKICRGRRPRRPVRLPNRTGSLYLSCLLPLPGRLPWLFTISISEVGRGLAPAAFVETAIFDGEVVLILLATLTSAARCGSDTEQTASLVCRIWRMTSRTSFSFTSAPYLSWLLAGTGKMNRIERKKKLPRRLSGEFFLCWHLPILPGRFQPSIVGTSELNCRVRDGNGCTLTVISTNYSGPLQSPEN